MFTVMVFVFPSSGWVNGAQLSKCLPMGSGEGIPCVAFLVCTDFVLSIELTQVFSHFYSSDSFSIPLQGMNGCVGSAAAGVKNHSGCSSPAFAQGPCRAVLRQKRDLPRTFTSFQVGRRWINRHGVQLFSESAPQIRNIKAGLQKFVPETTHW